MLIICKFLTNEKNYICFLSMSYCISRNLQGVKFEISQPVKEIKAQKCKGEDLGVVGDIE